MYLTEQHQIKRNHANYQEIDGLAYKSKNLYNRVNYEIRQQFFSTGIIPNKYQFFSHIVSWEEYTALPRKVSRRTVNYVFNNWKAYFAAIKAYKKNPTKFHGKPKMPKYLDKNGRFVVAYHKQAISKKDITLSQTNIKINTKKTNIQEIRIIPQKDCYIIEVIYKQKEVDLGLNPDNKIGLDLGVNNLVAIASNQLGFAPLLVNGRPLKSINHYYNKTKSKLQSILSKYNRFVSKRTVRLDRKRMNKMNYLMHHVSKFIVELCIKHDIGEIVIGKNDGWKSEINIGRRNNQNFCFIPHYKLIEQIKYKAKLVGINVIEQEESHTSKCSFLDNEKICHHDQYVGKRIKRGLFKTANDKLINADINGAYNILKKASPNAFSYGVQAVAVQPLSVDIKRNSYFSMVS